MLEPPRVRPPLTVGLVQPRLTGAPPEGDASVHELKFDGYRILAHADGNRVRLVTRPGNDWTSRAPGVVGALAELGARGTLIDGEAVLLHPDGSPNFFGLRARFRARGPTPSPTSPSASSTSMARTCAAEVCSSADARCTSS